MTSLETNVNSYDAGRKPHIHDKNRGKWEGQWDFYLSCIGHAFGLKNFTYLVGYMEFNGGLALIIPTVISTLIYIVPIFFVQSFLGQFSTTGYISVFRISPLFKGIGYVILALNFTSVIYYSSLATYPLLFFLKSFTFNTTWLYCNNSWNTEDCYELSNYTEYSGNYTAETLEPGYQYFMNEVLKMKDTSHGFDMSWTLALGGLLLWIIVAICIFNGIAMIGRILRYTTLIAISFIVIILIRLMFMPEADVDIKSFFNFDVKTLFHPITWITAPVVSTMTLGKGWGSTLTMASYQPFKKNTELYSLTVPFSILGVTIASSFMAYLIDAQIGKRSMFSMHYFDEHAIEFTFVGIPYFFGSIEASQMWCMMFYLMMFLCELNSVIIQVFSIITAICDEYVDIRNYRQRLSIALCAVCYILSLFFATNYMADAFKQFVACTYFIQLFICFLEILLLVWIYGRERFLRDVEFMLSRKFSVWKFYIIRFVTPTFIFFIALTYLVMALFSLHREALLLILLVSLIKGLPWIGIPGYAIAMLVTTTGTLRERFNKCTRPNDWYPADPVDRQKYELNLGTSDISQQLLEMEDHEVP